MLELGVFDRPYDHALHGEEDDGPDVAALRTLVSSDVVHTHPVEGDLAGPGWSAVWPFPLKERDPAPTSFGAEYSPPRLARASGLSTDSTLSCNTRRGPVSPTDNERFLGLTPFPHTVGPQLGQTFRPICNPNRVKCGLNVAQVYTPWIHTSSMRSSGLTSPSRRITGQANAGGSLRSIASDHTGPATRLPANEDLYNLHRAFSDAGGESQFDLFSDDRDRCRLFQVTPLLSTPVNLTGAHLPHAPDASAHLPLSTTLELQDLPSHDWCFGQRGMLRDRTPAARPLFLSSQLEEKAPIEALLKRAAPMDGGVAAHGAMGYKKVHGMPCTRQDQVVRVEGLHVRMRDKAVNTTSKYRGVTRHRVTGRFEAQLWDAMAVNKDKNKSGRARGRQVYLGGYAKEEAAAMAYDRAAIKFFGDKARLNFKKDDYVSDVELRESMTRDEWVAYLRSQSSAFSRGKSKYRGVTKHHHGKWEARISGFHKQRYTYLGTFTSEQEAARAYDMASIALKRQSAVLNFSITDYLDLSTGAMKDDIPWQVPAPLRTALARIQRQVQEATPEGAEDAAQ